MRVSKKAVKKYREFHGRDVRYNEDFSFHIPENFIILGRAVAIEYRTDKLNGGGDGKSAVYRHKFETPAVVCQDETGKRQLYILGEKIKVTSAGIEN